MTTLTGARVVTREGVLAPGWVSFDGGVITGVGAGSPPAGSTGVRDLGGAWLLPGYIDLHVHGGGGHDFGASPEDLAAGVAFHHAHGTTGTLISLVTAPVDTLSEQLRWVAARAEDSPLVLGAHLEGPFLSHARCGAQHPDHLLTPDAEVMATLLKAAQGHVRVVTVAPELPGALELVDQLREAGVVAAVGHSDARYDEAAAAFARGASLVTHAFNGMRPLHHREPGIVPAALDAGVPCEAINDGVHLHAGAVRLLAHGPIVLVTDAIDATGRPDGSYVLGGQEVTVRDGQARLARDGALAGSTLTMEDAVRRAVREVGLTVEAASVAASTMPARVLGLTDRGRIEPGFRADLVVLNDDLDVVDVLV
ncbi:N-acetylglucosamine-6-phosphate deacetylase [Virgisporangium aliadipatigenens]|uniref:N-acetylglucosamine-6-phosphate deacetylase n=1 Tax=Virgisporangium aliadipatigenens TaxID=741659 RepID=A0A8J3YNN0_9ACTN|nr:N-acetylglucosamine-6-phosphate deacetylase [Virgisporangium aliadipatigenens]GIJ47677.1 N-acetylglucosamine-6-phosphate deacetylase [Virgisporangium aliadipatigenens]